MKQTEVLIDPALIQHCAALLLRRSDCVMSTAAHPITDLHDYQDPNVVKVVLDAQQRALYFSRAPIPWWRDGGGNALPQHTASALRCTSATARRASAWTRRPIWRACARCSTEPDAPSRRAAL